MQAPFKYCMAASLPGTRRLPQPQPAFHLLLPSKAGRGLITDSERLLPASQGDLAQGISIFYPQLMSRATKEGRRYCGIGVGGLGL